MNEQLHVDDDRLEIYDVSLLADAQRGDLPAFAELYRRHSPAILRYAWAKLGAQDEAEETTQDTFTVAWAKRGKAPIVDESLLPWLLTICRNHVQNRLRERHRQRRRQADESTDDLIEPASGYEDSVLMRLELAKLSPIDRKLCELCLVDGLTYREAARLLDTSEAAVGKRLQRARARLRTAIGHDE